jgi:hypothetical protein
MNKKKVTVLVSVIISLVLVLVLCLLYLPNNKSRLTRFVINEYDSNESIYSFDKKSKIDGGFNSIKQSGTGKISFVVHNTNPVNPTVHFIQEISPENISRVDSTLLRRVDLFSYEIVNYKSFYVRNYTFNDLNKYVEQNNIYNENLDPENIEEQDTTYVPKVINGVEYDRDDITTWSPDSYLEARINNLSEDAAKEVQDMLDFCFTGEQKANRLYECLTEARAEVEEKYPIEEYPVTEY